MGVVDSSLEGGVLIVKIVINIDSLDEKTINFG